MARLVCDCGFISKAPAGLSSHKRACKVKVDPTTTVEALLKGRAATLKSSAVKLAAAIDVCDSERYLPALTRELRALLAELDLIDATMAGDGVDDLTRRRAARKSDATG